MARRLAGYIAVWALIIVLLVVVRLLKQYYAAPKMARIVTAHVVNMDESKERLAECMAAAAVARIPLQRWPAVDTRKYEEKDLAPNKLSKYIWKWAVEHKRLGMLGCYLSHRTLLQHLSTLPVSDNDAHLVLEDDAHIPADFWAQWLTVLQDVPPDWDMVQIGVTFPNLRNVKGRVHRHLNDRGNGGTFAYVVRHGALPKINAHIEYMSDPIDLMYRAKWREWKYYIIYPEICPHDDHGESIIVEKPKA